MKQILIAQLTDTHIRPGGAPAYGQVDTVSFLKNAIEHLNGLDPQPDAVAITGDLADFGTAEEYALFRQLIAALRAPYFVIPGNHDSAAIWDAFPECGARRPGPGLGYEAEVADLRLLMFDSSVEGVHFGLSSEERCAWLGDALRREPARPSLLFLHHPPFLTGIAHMDRNNCREAERLAATVSPTESLLAIGCGHIHRTIVTSFGGKPTVVAPSPAHAVSLGLTESAPATFHLEPPGVLLHRVTEEGGAWRHVTHLSHIGAFGGPHPFFAADGALA